jgi:hypothetical protein
LTTGFELMLRGIKLIAECLNAWSTAIKLMGRSFNAKRMGINVMRRASAAASREALLMPPA